MKKTTVFNRNSLWKKKIDHKMVTRRRALEIDSISRRYRKLPSEVLKLSLDEYQFDLLISQVALEDQNKVNKDGKKG